MKRKSRYLERATLIDVLHLAAILTCTLWTAKLIVEHRSGNSLSAMAVLGGAPSAPHGLTIRLDDAAQTAAR